LSGLLVYARLKNDKYQYGVGMSERILIVDDDIDTLRLVGMMLESEGFDIIAANNGQRGPNHPRHYDA
jgi:PleD family two-component response regulator